MAAKKQACVPPALRSHGTVRALTRELRVSPKIELCSVTKDNGG